MRWFWLFSVLVACGQEEEAACVWDGPSGTCYDTNADSCAEDDAVQGGATYHEGETCKTLGCTPKTDDPNEAWYECVVEDTGTP